MVSRGKKSSPFLGRGLDNARVGRTGDSPIIILTFYLRRYGNSRYVKQPIPNLPPKLKFIDTCIIRRESVMIVYFILRVGFQIPFYSYILRKIIPALDGHNTGYQRFVFLGRLISI